MSLTTIAGLVLILIGTVRITLTYGVFSETNDEPAHIAAGMEWIVNGRYAYEPQHPPLSRIFAAIGPYAAGIRSFGEKGLWEEGYRILTAENKHKRNLALARAGNLPFFWLASFVVWIWGSRLYGNQAGLLALLVFTNLPLVLAHSGLATTDMAAASTFVLSLYAAVRWLESPTIPRSLVFGLALALAALSKFTSFLFLGSALPILVLAHHFTRRKVWTKKDAWYLGCVVLSASFFFWAGFRFSFGVPNLPFRLPFGVPAPELLEGLRQVAHHAKVGHHAYFLGQGSSQGWWYFFPTLLVFKTPLPFLALFVAAVLFLAREVRGTGWSTAALRFTPVLVPLALLLVSMPATINIGLRHLLPAFPLMAMAAGYAAHAMVTYPAARSIRLLAVTALLVAATLPGIAAHPDYLPYFNLLAGEHPEHIVVDSDVDWGQDGWRLVDEINRRKIPVIHAAIYQYPHLAHSVTSTETHELPPREPRSGWVAISYGTLYTAGWKKESYIRRTSKRLTGDDLGFDWLLRYQPVMRIGKTIELYHVP